MLIKRSLWKWYARRARPVSGFAMLLVVVHVLLIQQEPYQTGSMLQWLFILLHGAALNWSVNSIGGTDGAFLYTRGFTRDTLWKHRILVTLVHALIVWAVAAALIWTGLRSAFQSSYLGNPEFPLMDGLDAGLPWRWLLGYLITLSALQYAGIRRWQPTRGAGSGFWIVLSLLALPELTSHLTQSDSVGSLCVLIALPVIAVLLAAVARRLHREIEVQA